MSGERRHDQHAGDVALRRRRHVHQRVGRAFVEIEP